MATRAASAARRGCGTSEVLRRSVGYARARRSAEDQGDAAGRAAQLGITSSRFADQPVTGRDPQPRQAAEIEEHVHLRLGDENVRSGSERNAFVADIEVIEAAVRPEDGRRNGY